MKKADYILLIILVSLLSGVSGCFGLAFSWYWEADFPGMEEIGSGSFPADVKDAAAIYLSDIERRELFAKAVKMGQEGDSSGALRLYKKLADDGFSPAIYELAGFYAEGLGGLTVDAKKAFSLYLQAARAGYGLAMYQLSRCYNFGYGVEVNTTEAYAWIKKAYESGVPEAGVELALYHEYGVAVPQDYQQAMKYYNEAVQQGSMEASANLGRILCFGPAEFRDFAKGVEYLERSDSAGVSEATVNLGLVREMAGDIEAAFQLYTKASAVGNSYGHYNRARFLSRFFPERAGPGEVFELYFLAAESGMGEAVVSLGDLFIKGRSFSGIQLRRLRDLRPVMEELAEQGRADVQRVYGDLLLLAEGVFDSEPEKARFLYEQAAASGDAFAMYRLGYGYEHNLFAVSNPEKGSEWYARAISHSKEPNSALQLGMMYLHGQGVEKNPLQAYILLRTAIEALGDEVVSAGVIDGLKENLSPEQLALAESLM